MYSLFRRPGFPIVGLPRLTGSAMRHRGKHLRHIALAVAVIVIGGAATAAKSEAATLHTVTFKNGNQGFTQGATSPTPFEQTFTTSTAKTFSTGTGFAGNGSLTNMIRSQRVGDSFFAAGGATEQRSISEYDDIMFIDPSNLLSTAFVNVAVSADFSASQTESNKWLSSFFLRLILNNVATDISLSLHTPGIRPGLGTSTPVSGTLTSSFVSVQLGTFIDFDIRAQLNNNLYCGSRSAPSCGNGEATSTSFVTFPTFILPEGIGVTSASLFPPSSVIPLPAALPLYGTGLAVMGFLGWRRKRQTMRT